MNQFGSLVAQYAWAIAAIMAALMAFKHLSDIFRSLRSRHDFSTLSLMIAASYVIIAATLYAGAMDAQIPGSHVASLEITAGTVLAVTLALLLHSLYCKRWLETTVLLAVAIIVANVFCELKLDQYTTLLAQASGLGPQGTLVGIQLFAGDINTWNARVLATNPWALIAALVLILVALIAVVGGITHRRRSRPKTVKAPSNTAAPEWGYTKTPAPSTDGLVEPIRLPTTAPSVARPTPDGRPPLTSRYPEDHKD